MKHGVVTHPFSQLITHH